MCGHAGSDGAQGLLQSSQVVQELPEGKVDDHWVATQGMGMEYCIRRGGATRACGARDDHLGAYFRNNR